LKFSPAPADASDRPSQPRRLATGIFADSLRDRYRRQSRKQAGPAFAGRVRQLPARTSFRRPSNSRWQGLGDGRRARPLLRIARRLN